MSYPDVIKAAALRQGDRVYMGSGATRRVMATCCRPGYSFMRFLVEGENLARTMHIGAPVYVRREP